MCIKNDTSGIFSWCYSGGNNIERSIFSDLVRKLLIRVTKKLAKSESLVYICSFQ